MKHEYLLMVKTNIRPDSNWHPARAAIGDDGIRDTYEECVALAKTYADKPHIKSSGAMCEFKVLKREVPEWELESIL